MPNGDIKALGFIKKVSEASGKRSLEIDYALLLTGQAAVQAAIADGVIPPGGTLDNDYYIQNQSKELRTFGVSPQAKIFTELESTDPQPVTWATFLSYWQSNASPGPTFRTVPWWIERSGSTIVNITEQFLP